MVDAKIYVLVYSPILTSRKLKLLSYHVLIEIFMFDR